MIDLQGILTTNSVCVTKIQSLDDDLTICSENEIHLDTPHLLIRNTPIHEYVGNLIFGTPLGAEKAYHRPIQYQGSKENVLNLGSTTFDSVDAMNITSSENYMNVSGIMSESYVELNAVNTLNIITPVYNIYNDDVLDHVDNILLKNTSGRLMSTIPTITNDVFKNYLYSLVNSAFAHKTGGFSKTVYSEGRPNDYEYSVENMGEYFTNTIITNKITTRNVNMNDNTQPRLTVRSGSAINLDAPVIVINDVNLDDIIKQTFDENGLITISTTLNNLNEISFIVDSFEVNTYTTQFTYDIEFYLIPRDSAIVNVNVTFQNDTFVFNPIITQFIKGTTYLFDNTENKHGHPLAFHNQTNRDTSTYLYTQDLSGFVAVQDFSEYDILYATDLSDYITVGNTMKYVDTLENYMYMKLQVLKNYGSTSYTAISNFFIDDVIISSISDTTTTTSHDVSKMIDGNVYTYFQTTQTSPFDVIIEFQSKLPTSFTATFINLWNDQGWNEVDVYVSPDGLSWTLVKEIRSELAYSTSEDVPGRTTEINVNLPSQEVEVNTDKNSINDLYTVNLPSQEVEVNTDKNSINDLYKVILPIKEYKSLYFTPGNSVGFKSTTSIAIPTNSFAWSYWVKFDTGLCNCTNAYLGGPLNLFPYFVSETTDEVVVRGYPSDSSLGQNDVTLSKGNWHHICRTYTLPEGATHSSTNVWREGYYINGQTIYNEDVNPTALRIPSYFDSYPYPLEDTTTLMHTTNTWEFDLYWNFSRARTLRPDDNNHEDTYVNAQIAHFALWMNTHLTQEAVNELYNAGHVILQQPITSVNLPTREIKYTFEVSIASSDKNWVIIQHIKSHGIELSQNTSFIRYNIITSPQSPNVNQMIVDYMFDNDNTTFTAWRDYPPTVGTQLFDLYFSEPITNFELLWRLTNWKPGIKIYENDVIVYNDTSVPVGTIVRIDDKDMNLQGYNFTNQFGYDAYTLYENATHYYPFGDNKLSDVNGTNDLQFLRVQSNSLVYETGSTSLMYVSFPQAQQAVNIPTLLNLNDKVIYTNVSVDEFGNVNSFEFYHLYIDIPVHPVSIGINNITHEYSSTTNHIFSSIENNKYYNMYADVTNTHTNTTIKLLLNSDVIKLTPIILTLSNDLTFNVVQYNITVNVVDTVQGLRYQFDPHVTSFQNGDIYVFDNTLNIHDHPLNFHNTNSRGELFVYQQNEYGFVTVTVDNLSEYDKLYAHCTKHGNMGSIVNDNSVGISVVNSSHPRQYYTTLGVTNFNGTGFSIDMTNPPTMTDAIYDKFENNRLYFTFDNDTNAVSIKDLYVKVIDNLNTEAELIQSYIFPSDHMPLFTNQTLSLTGIDSYSYSFKLNGVTYNESSPLPKSIINITPQAPFINGTINAYIELTNSYGFNRFYDLGNYTVTRPTAASELKLEFNGPNGFIATFYNDGVNGNPIDTIVSVYLYYQKTLVVSRSNYEGFVNITLNTPVDFNVNLSNTVYSFIICTEYDNYGFIDSEVFYSNQLEVSSLVSFILGQSIKNINNGIYSNGSLTWRDMYYDKGSSYDGYNANGMEIGSVSLSGNDFKYLTTRNSKSSFGRFSLGNNSFTLAFVIRIKGNENTWRLTFGITPHDRLNIHYGRKDPRNYNNGMGINDNSTKTESEKTKFFSSDVCFLMYTYDRDTSNGTYRRMLFNYNGDVCVDGALERTNYHSTSTSTFTSGNTTDRIFTLATTNNSHFIKILDMIILPGVSVNTDFQSNIVTDPNYGMILDYLKRTYGFTPGEALSSSNIVLTSRTSKSIVLSWSANSNGTATLNNYVVYNVTTGKSVTVAISTSYNWTQSLNPNTGYIFKVEKLTSNGNFMSDDSLPLYTDVVASAPNTPTKVSTSDTFIKIRWIPNSNGGDTFSKYVVNNLTHFPHQTHDITNINTTQYKWPNLNSNTSYTFSVTKVTNTGSYTSPTSDPFTTLFAQPEAPNTPTYSNIQSTSLTISWIENSHGDTTLYYYSVNRVALDDDSNILESKNRGRDTSYIWSGLTKNTQYRFSITKVSTHQGTAINKTSSSSPQYTLRDALPVIIYISTFDYKSISVNWNTNSNGDANILRYEVNLETSLLNRTIIQTHTVNKANNSFTIPDLDKNTEYYISVSKITDLNSPISEPVLPQSTRDIIYSEDVSVTVTSYNLVSISISWSVNQNNDGIVSGYTVNVSGKTPIDLGNVTSYTIPDLTPDTEYHITVTKNTNLNTYDAILGNPVSINVVQMTDGTYPWTLLNPDGTGLDYGHSISVIQSFSRASYSVYDVLSVVKSSTYNTALYIVDNIPHNRIYIHNSSHYLNTSYQRSDIYVWRYQNTDLLPADPVTVSVVTVSFDTISISWTPNSNGGTTVFGYIVNLETSSSDRTIISSTNVGNVTSYTIPNLTHGTTYYISVTKLTNNNHPVSSIVYPSTRAITEFAEAVTVFVKSYTGDSITISWIENSNGQTTVQHYEVFYGLHPDVLTPYGYTYIPSHFREVTIGYPGLYHDTLYYIKVVKHTNGNSISSDIIDQRTSFVLIQPDPITFYSTTAYRTGIHLRWNENYMGSATLNGYAINLETSASDRTIISSYQIMFTHGYAIYEQIVYNLNANTDYYLSVTKLTNQNDPISAQIHVRTLSSSVLDPSPASPPTINTIYRSTAHIDGTPVYGIDINWNTNNNGPGLVNNYLINFETSSLDRTPIRTISTNRYDLTSTVIYDNLQNNTTYYISVTKVTLAYRYTSPMVSFIYNY